MVDYNKKPILQMNNITKEFSGVYALSGITFDLYQGEIHCLVGENGAGKSTLMKVLSGAYSPSSGTIVVKGNDYKTLTPRTSKEQDISIIYQENDLVPTMSIVENIYVGNEITKRFGFINFKAMLEKTTKEMKNFGIDIDPKTKIENLSVAEQQFVKILKALVFKPNILIMDEPTSMFNVEDARKVLQLTKRISAKGISIIYISHFLNEIVEIADRVTVIRDGKVVNTYFNKNKDIKISSITEDMVGRPVEMFYEKEKNSIGDVMLEVKNLKLKKDSPQINFKVNKGEILGFSGMVGSGRTEMIRGIIGADSRYSGNIYINGEEVVIKNPQQSINHGFAYITEDRQALGLVLNNSVLENTTIIGLRNKIKGFFINVKKFPLLVENIIKDLRIKTPSIWSDVIYLSGGNQQKVVLAKWLFADQDIYIFDEPTRGIDVNAKAEFYKQMSNLTANGKCIIMISSDMPELISMSDRVIIIRDGNIDSELLGSDITEQQIIKRALGVNKNEE